MGGFYAGRRRGQTKQREDELKAAIVDVMCHQADGLPLDFDLSPAWQVELQHKMYDLRHLKEICFEIQRDALSEFGSPSKAEAGQYDDLWVDQLDASGRRVAETGTLFAFGNLRSPDKRAARTAQIGAGFLHGYYDFDVQWVDAQRKWRLTFRVDNGPAQSWLLTLRDNVG